MDKSREAYEGFVKDVYVSEIWDDMMEKGFPGEKKEESEAEVKFSPPDSPMYLNDLILLTEKQYLKFKDDIDPVSIVLRTFIERHLVLLRHVRDSQNMIGREEMNKSCTSAPCMPTPSECVVTPNVAPKIKRPLFVTSNGVDKDLFYMIMFALALLVAFLYLG